MFFNQQETVTDSAIKMSPIGVTSGLAYMNVTIPDLIQYLTLVYAVLLVAEKLYAFYVKYRESKK